MTSRADESPGFTLVELLVVLVIMGLLLIALPRPLARLMAGRLDAAVEQVATDLRRARSRAVLTATPQRFVLDLAGRRFGLLDGTPAMLPDGIEVGFIGAREERLAERAAAIRFFPDGSSSGGRVRLADAARRVEVRVDWLTGRVTVVDG
jgi:general secretion pathway protein H